eukprot:gene9950-7821_t
MDDTDDTALRTAILEALKGEDPSAGVAAALAGAPGAKTLDVSDASMDLQAGITVATAVKSSTTLTCFNLSNNAFASDYEEMADALAAILKENTVLQVLDISGIGIGTRGTNVVAMSLAANATLIELRMDGNPGVGDEGASVMGAGINANTHLVKLSMADSGITDEGAGYFAAALNSNAALQYLDLSANLITAAGAKELADVLTTEVSMGLPWVLLDLSGNIGIGDEGAIHLADALEDPNASLQQLKLSNCGIGDDGACALASSETPLEVLDLRNNPGIGDKGTAALNEVTKTKVVF